MVNNVKIGSRVQMTWVGGLKISGEVLGIERNDDDSVSGILVLTPQALETGSIHLGTEDLADAQFQILECVEAPAMELSRPLFN